MSLQKIATLSLALTGLGAIASLPAQVRPAATTADVEVRVSPTEGRRLVEEALAQDQSRLVSLTLQPGASAFRVEGNRVVLLASAESGPLTCPVRISGVPVIDDNRLVLTSADITTSGMMCNGALDLLRQKSLEALATHPWDLARHLAQASADQSRPTPRLPGSACLLASQIRLRSVRVQPAYLAVGVMVLPRNTTQACG